jgi:biotin-dependent carboxylase-like uncharacterized protein
VTLHVLSPGLHTRIVDFGRPRTRSLGVPVGGAVDRSSLAIGNAFVGNPPDAAALEITLGGPTLRADCELACVVYGAPFELATDRRPLAAGKTFTLEPGEELRIGGTPEKVRAYLCVRGGIGGPTILGSRSDLQPIQTDDQLACAPGRISSRTAHIEANWEPWWANLFLAHSGFRFLRVLDGSQATWFNLDDELYGSADGLNQVSFAVAAASDRMGLRLQGRPLSVPSREMVSEPVCPGSVQVTRDGQCIVLGIDGQTIGGYPKIAQVISADLDILGQLRPGERVLFARVSLEEAEQAYRAKTETLREWVTRLRTAAGAF